jgi:hypothetical protein
MARSYYSKLGKQDQIALCKKLLEEEKFPSACEGKSVHKALKELDPLVDHDDGMDFQFIGGIDIEKVKSLAWKYTPRAGL